MAKIISFHGADHKVGVSQIAASTAELLAKSLKDKEILLINADGEYGLDYYADLEISNELESLLIEDVLNVSRIKEITRVNNNFFILNFSKSITLSNINPDIVEELITKLYDSFDLILIDTGSSLENAVSLGSLFKSDFIFYLLNQKEYSLLRAENNKGLYDLLQIHFDKYILNQYSKNKLFESSYIQERMQIAKEDILIVHENKRGLLAEIEHRSILSYKPKRRYIKEIETITKEIISHAGL